MKKEREKVVINSSHLWLRVIGFALAALVGVGAIGYGISAIGHKDPGYYEIEAAASEEATPYANGISFLYYFEGEGNEIKTKMNELKDLYSAALLRSYQLLDSENTYEGYVNLASLNEGLGQEMQVSEELFQILTDAWNKTQEQRGFNLFAGALFQEWNSILSLDDISEFDPATSPETASRIQALAEKTRELDYFDLRIVDSKTYTVQINVSQEYLDFLEQNEYDGSVISLNLLSDAYRLDLVRDELEARGFTNGYLYTDSGLTLSLSGHDGGAYAMYSFDGEQVAQSAAIDAGANSVCSYLRVFPLEENEIMYHIVPGDSGVRYYHPCFVTATGAFANVLSASCTVRYDGDVVESCYENLILFNLDSREAVLEAASGETTFVCSFLSDGGSTLYTNNPSAVQGSEGIQVKTF